MRETYPIIALEGLSGTGKTTVGKLLASKTSGRYFHCKEKNLLEPTRQFFNKTPQIISFFFYIVYFSFSLKRAKKLAQNSIIYMDKSAAWIHSHYKARNFPKFLLRLIPGYLKRELDLILYFTLNKKDRHQRVKRRMKIGKATINDILSLEMGEKTDKFYREFLPQKLLEIKTDRKSPKTVATEVIKELNKLKFI